MSGDLPELTKGLCIVWLLLIICVQLGSGRDGIIAILSCVASWVVTEGSPVAEAMAEAVVYILKYIDSMLITFLYYRFKYIIPP